MKTTIHPSLRGAFLAIVTLLVTAIIPVNAIAIPITYQKSGVPDFGQNVETEWGACYCAPTSAANSVWWFSQNGYPDLSAGYNWNDDAGATSVINDLGTLMNTNPASGTTDANIRDGLDSYLDFYYPGEFYVKLFYATDLGGGLNLWNFMKQELYRSEDVLPLVSWTTGGGHAMTMTGYRDNPTTANDDRIDVNDPATNGGTHNWAGEYLGISITGFLNDRITLAPWASGTGYIDAVVVASPIPEPGILVLLLTGLLLATVSRRPRIICRRR